MAYPQFLARRYILSHGKQHFFSFIALLTIAGVALGTASMIVVLSVIGGFEQEFRERFLAANAHLLMYQYPDGTQQYGQMAAKARQILQRGQLPITGMSPFIHHETMVKNQGGLVATLVRGIHPSKRNHVQPYAHLITPQRSLEHLEQEVIAYDPRQIPGVILGVGLARLLAAEPGDEVRFLVPAQDTGFGLYKNFVVLGIYDSGLSHYDNKLAIVSIPGAQDLMQTPGTVTGIEIGLEEPWSSQRAEQLLRGEFAHMVVRNWQDYNQAFFEAIQYEKVLISLLVALVALVGGFNILTTLFVSVFQKERDILLLMALGSTKRQVMEIFVYQGIYMGLAGSVLGCGLAFLLAQAIETYQFVSLPQVYMLAQLPVEYDPIVYGLTTAASLSIATFAGLLPAIAAIKGDLSTSLKSR